MLQSCKQHKQQGYQFGLACVLFLASIWASLGAHKYNKQFSLPVMCLQTLFLVRGLVWEWDKQRSGNETSKGLGMRRAKVWEWDKQRSGNETSKGLGMRQAKVWEWDKQRYGNEATQIKISHYVSTLCLLWKHYCVWQDLPGLSQRRSDMFDLC